ncbi:hypothetical protein DFH08DRAFT_835742 [Mycena albidolilacea]|uniref:Complex 1 LYR protein domain-containing protein n=1 Tax=Mycena albidolilacea TaxID=1033008 RepID=A0AAD7F3H0_9AGAR|nr:hypothetical protein DFH08DRAFT_835742 [Mycena albidolilacea]
MSSARRSGLQKEVLNLYRRALRIPRTKPTQTRAKWDLLIRYSFRNNAASVSPRDVSAIEHLLRVGGRQIALYEDASVRDCQVSAEMRVWEQTQTQRQNRTLA